MNKPRVLVICTALAVTATAIVAAVNVRRVDRPVVVSAHGASTATWDPASFFPQLLIDHFAEEDAGRDPADDVDGPPIERRVSQAISLGANSLVLHTNIYEAVIEIRNTTTGSLVQTVGTFFKGRGGTLRPLEFDRSRPGLEALIRIFDAETDSTGGHTLLVGARRDGSGYELLGPPPVPYNGNTFRPGPFPALYNPMLVDIDNDGTAEIINGDDETLPLDHAPPGMYRLDGTLISTDADAVLLEHPGWTDLGVSPIANTTTVPATTTTIPPTTTIVPATTTTLAAATTVAVDRTPPVVSLNAVSDGAVYQLGNVPQASCSATMTLR